MRTEQITDAVAHHAEGPVRDASLGRRLWVDMLQTRSVLRLECDDEIHVCGLNAYRRRVVRTTNGEMI